ncbi:hypothetical protein VcTj87_21840 [Vibrio comitans]
MLQILKIFKIASLLLQIAAFGTIYVLLTLVHFISTIAGFEKSNNSNNNEGTERA